MTNSSVSTYLDITRAAKGWAEPSRETLDIDTIASSAKVVAALHKGSEVVPDISAQAELSLDQVLGALGWLSKNGLVTVEEAGGSTLVAHLTDPARSALDQA